MNYKALKKIIKGEDDEVAQPTNGVNGGAIEKGTLGLRSLKLNLSERLSIFSLN